MREEDALENNPQVSRRALAGLHGELYGWSLSRCGFDHAAAEDLMQQAYVEVLSGRARFDNKSKLKTFLFGVVQNLARSRFRRLATRLRLVKTYAVDLRAQVGEGGVEEHGAAEDHAEKRRIWQAVEALPARQRDITELVFCRDLSVAEASAVMGISVGTGRVHYDRAKNALAKSLATVRAIT